jgi:serine O-acetyltransferase
MRWAKMLNSWMFWDDYRRYKSNLKNIFFEPSIIIVFLYRLRSSLYPWLKFPFLKFPAMIFIEPWYYFLTLLFGIHIPKTCKIGKGLMIHHFGGIVINPKTEIGENCTIRHSVTIGNRKGEDDIPIIGDFVNIGVGAIIIGKIRVGNYVDIGANAVVLKDVPDNSVAVGIPARIISKKIG